MCDPESGQCRYHGQCRGHQLLMFKYFLDVKLNMVAALVRSVTMDTISTHNVSVSNIIVFTFDINNPNKFSKSQQSHMTIIIQGHLDSSLVTKYLRSFPDQRHFKITIR